jgi:two-component system response regulator MprA
MRIVVAEDEPTVREAIELALSLEGYEVESVPDGAEALAALDRCPADALVLDVAMPLLSGLDVCRRLRAAGSDLPILIVTAREAVAQRVEGLDAGADDYLVKPFALDELLARVRALVRRQVREQGTVLRYGDLELDLDRYLAFRGGRELGLTRTEFSLLELLLEHRELVLTRQLITDRIWQHEIGSGSNILEVYISYLRQKLEAGGEPRIVQTVRGVGYVLRA